MTAFTYPLALSVFADELDLDSISARPGWQQQHTGLASGYGITDDLAPALREWDVRCRSRPHVEAAEIMALIEALGGSLREFYLYDPRKLYPAADLDGSALGSATVQIKALNANNHALSLKGLPAGYVLTRGDFFCFDYSSSPTRRAFHRVAEASVTADGSGDTAEFEVTPNIRTGAAVDDVITLKKPAMKCKMIPGSLRDESDGPLMTVVAFSVRQVI